MKKQTRTKITQIYRKNNFKHSEELLEAYKDGFTLAELCNLFHIDALTVLKVIKKARITNTQLYLVFQEQEEHQETVAQKKRNEKEQYLLIRYFPTLVNDITTKTYWRYIATKNYKQDKVKEVCQHSVRHIRCAKCNKILADASNISLPTPRISIDNLGDKT
jgi:hypothetical protein